MHVKNNNIIYGTSRRINREFIDNENKMIKNTMKNKVSENYTHNRK